jgi:hypothetical protein
MIFPDLLNHKNMKNREMVLLRLQKIKHKTIGNTQQHDKF